MDPGMMNNRRMPGQVHRLGQRVVLDGIAPGLDRNPLIAFLLDPLHFLFSFDHRSQIFASTEFMRLEDRRP